MRVITGKAKGCRLIAPKGLHTRPTSDKVKESLFNILGNISEDSIVLDLYSGSGNVGIEFLSRGANSCYFIDNDINSIKSIKENLKRTKFTDQAFVYKNTVERALHTLSKKDTTFDFIFMDPPYRKEIIIPILEKICGGKLLNDYGLVIVEHESNLELPENILELNKVDSRQYGGTAISFYKYRR